MSDQKMNAGDMGSQPDSGSAPNDQVTVSGAGGHAPDSSGSQPAGGTSNIGSNDVPGDDTNKSTKE